MNSIRFLHAALMATAAIHVSYIGILWRRYQRLRGEKPLIQEKGIT